MARWPQLEGRDGGKNSVSRTRGIVLRLTGDFGRGEAEVGRVRGTGTDALRDLGSELHILVASSTENLLLFIKCRGLREGDTAATVRSSSKSQRYGSKLQVLQVNAKVGQACTCV